MFESGAGRCLEESVAGLRRRGHAAPEQTHVEVHRLNHYSGVQRSVGGDDAACPGKVFARWRNS